MWVFFVVFVVVVVVNIKGSKNVFRQNQYRCRDGAPDQVAAWKNQLAEKV